MLATSVLTGDYSQTVKIFLSNIAKYIAVNSPLISASINKHIF